MNGDAETARFFFPLIKADAEKRLIYARAASEVPDKAKEIMDYATAKPQFEAWSKRFSDATMGKSLGNVRAMHNPRHLAGKVQDLMFDDDGKNVDIVIKVLDPIDWNKAEEGGYTGVSIGGGYLKKWQDPEDPTLTRYTPRIGEISLVDAPCIPTATFMELQKQDGSVERVLLKGVMPRTFEELLPPATFGERLEKSAMGMIAGATIPGAGTVFGAQHGWRARPRKTIGSKIGGVVHAGIDAALGSNPIGGALYGAARYKRPAPPAEKSEGLATFDELLEKARSRAHPGFAGAAARVARSEGVTAARARAIIGAASHHASNAAIRHNPRLRRVPGVHVRKEAPLGGLRKAMDLSGARPWWQKKANSAPMRVSRGQLGPARTGGMRSPLLAPSTGGTGLKQEPDGELGKLIPRAALNTPEARAKIHQVLHEAKHGKLHSFRRGVPKKEMPIVRGARNKQAIAIALSQAARAAEKSDALSTAIEERLTKGPPRFDQAGRRLIAAAIEARKPAPATRTLKNLGPQRTAAPSMGKGAPEQFIEDMARLEKARQVGAPSPATNALNTHTGALQGMVFSATHPAVAAGRIPSGDKIPNSVTIKPVRARRQIDPRARKSEAEQFLGDMAALRKL